MRKLIATVALVTAVAVGGLAVAAVNPLQLVSAKSTSTSSPAADPSFGKVKAGSRGRVAGELLDKALADVVEKGIITKEQAAAVKRSIKDTAKQFRAEHKSRRARAFRKALRRGVVKTSAKAIGVTPKELVAGLKGGRSIAQLAQAKNVEPQTVITAIVNAGSAKVDAAVKSGRINAAKAAKIKQRLPQLVEKVVNRVPRHKGG